jgi:hypothetical protein
MILKIQNLIYRNLKKISKKLEINNINLKLEKLIKKYTNISLFQNNNSIKLTH